MGGQNSYVVGIGIVGFGNRLVGHDVVVCIGYGVVGDGYVVSTLSILNDARCLPPF